MSRRSTPERLDAARSAATLARLTGEGVSQERATEWMARWEAEAARRGLARDGRFFDVGYDWIATERKGEAGRRE